MLQSQDPATAEYHNSYMPQFHTATATHCITYIPQQLCTASATYYNRNCFIASMHQCLLQLLCTTTTKDHSSSGSLVLKERRLNWTSSQLRPPANGAKMYLCWPLPPLSALLTEQVNNGWDVPSVACCEPVGAPASERCFIIHSGVWSRSSAGSPHKPPFNSIMKLPCLFLCVCVLRGGVGGWGRCR